jgi:hypothetical protein
MAQILGQREDTEENGHLAARAQSASFLCHQKSRREMSKTAGPPPTLLFFYA